ncbi:hypothetical protein K492DRAFT_233511 [Lichtheimia hyalospora FSU 10163]|nr:hypothetical protein K492DRAFT_233511 [Lichtheimia hyalospora FSU 10163]
MYMSLGEDRMEEIIKEKKGTIQTLRLYSSQLEKDLAKHTRLLTESEHKVTLQTEYIARQEEKTKTLQEQVSKQKRLIDDMTTFIITQLGFSALDTFYNQSRRSSHTERNEYGSIPVHHTQPDSIHAQSSHPIHVQTQTDPEQPPALLPTQVQSYPIHTQNQPDFIPVPERPKRVQHNHPKSTPLHESQLQNMIPSQADSKKSGHVLSKKNPNLTQSTMPLTRYARENLTNASAISGDRSLTISDSSTENHPVQPYIETVRKKDERAKLHGASCKCCKEYYHASGALPGPDGKLMTPEERIQLSSRHRTRFKRGRTPSTFWDDLEFISSQQVNGEKDPRSPTRSPKRSR